MSKLSIKRFASFIALLILTVNVVAVAAGNQSEQTTTATIKIKTALVLSKVLDLRFADAYRSDVAETVANGSAGAATFTLTGDNSKTYAVSFPDGTSVEMKTGAGDTAQRKILVNAFTHDSTGVIASGTGAFSVGATRAAILVDQEVSDTYTANFKVRVTYN